MKKIFNTLVALFVVSYFIQIASASQFVCACRQPQQGNTTGAACSISELNNLEKMKTEKSEAVLKFRPEKNLRPVRTTLEITNYNDCFLGKCLYKHSLDIR